MAKKYKKRRNRKPSRRSYRFNMATIIALCVFAYLLVRTGMSLNKPTVSTYEVTAQKIYDKIVTTAIAVREEKVVNTSQAGYITYYVADKERVGVNSSIYAIDSSGNIMNQLEDDTGNVTFSDDDYQDLKSQILDYKKIYDSDNFNTIYDFKYALDNNIMEITNDSLIKKVDDLVASGKASSLNKVKAGESGVVSYSYDGMENISVDTIKESDFDHPENQMKQIRTSTMYESGAPIYRLVTSENWNLVIPLTVDQYNQLKDEKYLTVKFKKNGEQATRTATFYNANGFYYVALSFNKMMEQYMDDRYLDVEVVQQSISGLKLPNSSLLKQKLYAIPIDYSVQSDEAVSGISFNKVSYKKNGDRKGVTIGPAICYVDEKAGFYYVSGLDVSPGDVLVKNASEQEVSSGDFSAEDTYTIGATKTFEGVFTINKGFAQFVVITKLYQADDFCIAENNTEYGIAQYDHVVLDSASIQEGQIIY